MNTKEKIEELERRIRELEARPLPFPQYIPYPVYPVCPAPVYPSWPTYPYRPWQPWPTLPDTGPRWISDAGATMTGGNSCFK